MGMTKFLPLAIAIVPVAMLAAFLAPLVASVASAATVLP